MTAHIHKLIREEADGNEALRLAEEITALLARQDADRDIAVAALACSLGCVIGQYPAELRDYVIRHALETAQSVAPHTIPLGEL